MVADVGTVGANSFGFSSEVELSESEEVPEITGDSTSAAPKLSDDSSSEEKPKELAPTVPTSATKAELDVGNNDSTLGSQDLTKP